MATKHHYEALRKQRVLDRAKEARENLRDQQQQEVRRIEEERVKQRQIAEEIPDVKDKSTKKKEKRLTQDKAIQTVPKAM